MRSLMVCTAHKILFGVSNGVGGARSTYDSEREVLTWFGWSNVEERDHLEDKGIHGSILKRIFKT
jgi:hypothetical protein